MGVPRILYRTIAPVITLPHLTINSEGPAAREGEEQAVRDPPGAVAGHVHGQQAEAGHVAHVHERVGAVAGAPRAHVYHL